LQWRTVPGGIVKWRILSMAGPPSAAITGTSRKITCRIGRRSFFVYLLAASANLLPSRTFANGDAFFDDNGMPLEEDLVYFGSVKDEKGGYVQDAIVRANITFTLESGPRQLSYDVKTNVIGRYRTINLGRTFIGFGVEADPNLITLSVRKEGYSEVRKLNRSKYGQTQSIEVDFVMAKK